MDTRIAAVCGVLVCALPDVGCGDGLIPGRAFFLTPQEFGRTFRDEPLWAMEGRLDRVSGRQAGLSGVSAVGVSATILVGVMPSVAAKDDIYRQGLGHFAHIIDLLFPLLMLSGKASRPGIGSRNGN